MYIKLKILFVIQSTTTFAEHSLSGQKLQCHMQITCTFVYTCTFHLFR